MPLYPLSQSIIYNIGGEIPFGHTGSCYFDSWKIRIKHHNHILGAALAAAVRVAPFGAFNGNTQ